MAKYKRTEDDEARQALQDRQDHPALLPKEKLNFQSRTFWLVRQAECEGRLAYWMDVYHSRVNLGDWAAMTIALKQAHADCEEATEIRKMLEGV